MPAARLSDTHQTPKTCCEVSGTVGAEYLARDTSVLKTGKVLYRMTNSETVALRPYFYRLNPCLKTFGELNLDGIHWVIVGGESGKGYRPMDHGWARDIRDQCVEKGVAFFFKQSAAYRTELGTDLEETDGTRTTWNHCSRIPVSGNPGNYHRAVDTTLN